jgi:hypothetical protein
MIVCDTDVLIDIIRKHPPAVHWVSMVNSQELIIPGYAAMELVQGCRSLRDIRAIKTFLQPYKLAWPTAPYCEYAYQTFLTFRVSEGLGLIDAMIAQTAIGLDKPLHTFNQKHFDFIPGLRTAQPFTK